MMQAHQLIPVTTPLDMFVFYPNLSYCRTFSPQGAGPMQGVTMDVAQPKTNSFPSMPVPLLGATGATLPRPMNPSFNFQGTRRIKHFTIGQILTYSQSNLPRSMLPRIQRYFNLWVARWTRPRCPTVQITLERFPQVASWPAWARVVVATAAHQIAMLRRRARLHLVAPSWLLRLTSRCMYQTWLSLTLSRACPCNPSDSTICK